MTHQLDREHRRPDVPAIRAAVSEEHGVHVHEVVLIRHASIPKTTSGKIQRRACRSAYLDGALEVIGRVAAAPGPAPDVGLDHLAAAPGLTGDTLRSLPENERPFAVIAYLQNLIAPLAEVAARDVSVQRPLISLGFDSLMAVELCSRVGTDRGIATTLESLSADETLSQLTTQILAQVPTAG